MRLNRCLYSEHVCACDVIRNLPYEIMHGHLVKVRRTRTRPSSSNATEAIIQVKVAITVTGSRQVTISLLSMILFAHLHNLAQLPRSKAVVLSADAMPPPTRVASGMGKPHTTTSASRHMQERHTPARCDSCQCDWLAFRGSHSCTDVVTKNMLLSISNSL